MRLILLLMMLLNGPGRDLLDYVPSADYWANQRVPMTEEEMLRQIRDQGSTPSAGSLIADMTADRFDQRDRISHQLALMGPAILPLLRAAEAGSTDSDFVDHVHRIELDIAAHRKLKLVRRLMAIRGLGELGDRAALEPLKALLTSREPFEADYAESAIAAINHHPRRRPMLNPGDLEGDLALLPASVSWLGQERLSDGGPVPLEMLISSLVGSVNSGEPVGEFENRFRSRVVRQLIRLVNFTGNARVDGMTVGMSPEGGEGHRYGVMIVTGQFSASEVREELTNIFGLENVPGDATTVRFTGGRVMIPSDHQLIVISEDGDDVVLKAVQSALGNKSGTAVESVKKLADVGRVDPAGNLWVVARGGGHGTFPLFDGCETITLHGSTEGGHLVLRLTGQGNAAAIDVYDRQLQIEVKSAQVDLHSDTQDALGASLGQILLDMKSGHDAGTFWAEVDLVGNARSMLLLPALNNLPYRYGNDRKPENRWQNDRR